jgi:hypothetical protein
MMPIRQLAIAFALALTARAAEAQTARAPHACFRGAPGDRCTWFPLIEAGIHTRLTDLIPGDEHVMLNWSLGFMVNRGPRTAIGGAVFASVEGEIRAGAGLRWRRWLGRQTSLDLGAGVHLAGDASSGNVRAGSPTFEARLGYGDLIAGTARLDLLRINAGFSCNPTYCPFGPSGTSTRLYLGAELGSYAGVAGYAATGVLFIIALVALSNGSYF